MVISHFNSTIRKKVQTRAKKGGELYNSVHFCGIFIYFSKRKTSYMEIYKNGRIQEKKRKSRMQGEYREHREHRGQQGNCRDWRDWRDCRDCIACTIESCSICRISTAGFGFLQECRKAREGLHSGFLHKARAKGVKLCFKCLVQNLLFTNFG